VFYSKVRVPFECGSLPRFDEWLDLAAQAHAPPFGMLRLGLLLLIA